MRLKVVKSNVLQMSVFQWTPEKSRAAMLLAEGFTYKQVGGEIKKSEKTIQRWMADVEFSAEVDRLTLMLGIASKAERLRLAKRVIRQQDSKGVLSTDRDLLDWLKFAQSETDGIKLDIATLLAAIGTDEASVADSGSGRDRAAKTA